jgi:hypothetical protein
LVEGVAVELVEGEVEFFGELTDAGELVLETGIEQLHIATEDLCIVRAQFIGGDTLADDFEDGGGLVGAEAALGLFDLIHERRGEMFGFDVSVLHEGDQELD